MTARPLYSVGAYLARDGKPSGVHWTYESGYTFSDVLNKIQLDFKLFKGETIEKLIIKLHTPTPK